MKLPSLPARKILPILYKIGFYERSKHGSHLTLKRDSDGRMVTIPIHPGRDIPKGTLRSIIDQAGLTQQKFIQLLRKKRA